MKTFKNLIAEAFKPLTFVKESIQADKIDSAIATQKKRLEFAKLMAKKSEQDKKERMATKDARAYRGKTESVELDEAAKDYSAMFDALKKGDMVTIKYDSSIKKGSEGTFKVTFKSVVGKSKVGKITMTRQGDNAGKMKYYLYNRNGNVTLALGDMGASMTSLVKESVEVELDETSKNPWATNPTIKKNSKKVAELWDKHNALYDKTQTTTKLSEWENLRKEMKALEDAISKINDSTYKTLKALGESVDLAERDYRKEYDNYQGRPEQIANRSSRNKARRIMAKENDVDGMDVGHADNDPLNNDPKNLRLENPSDNRREPRMRSEELVVEAMGYELYHKDFSSAMKHAYEYAKSGLGIIVDPSEIDDKVAMGPKKPSNGKTNSYRLLGKDGKKAIQVQVYNMGNSYELNMYRESVELDESRAAATKAALSKQAEVSKKGKEKVTLKTAPWYKKESVDLDEAPRRKGAPKIKPDFLKVQRAKDAEHNAAMGRTATGRKKPVRTMTSTQKSLASMRREGVKLEDFTIADVIAEEVFNEAFKAGGLKLDDGKQVLVKKEDAKMLNDLMTQLSGTNSKKMTATAMRDKKGFAEILGFAKETSQ